MRLPFPDDIPDLNATDFDILRCLHRNGPLWKMEITRRVNGRRADGDLLLDLKESISKQAIAKRVERLHELDHLETTIITAGSVDVMVDPGRDFIIGYRPSSTGEDLLGRAVRAVLRDAVAAGIERGTTPGDMDGLERYLDLYGDLHGTAVDDLERFVAVELER